MHALQPPQKNVQTQTLDMITPVMLQATLPVTVIAQETQGMKKLLTSVLMPVKVIQTAQLQPQQRQPQQLQPQQRQPQQRQPQQKSLQPQHNSTVLQTADPFILISHVVNLLKTPRALPITVALHVKNAKKMLTLFVYQENKTPLI